jgi:hypothetical protein
VKAGARTQFRGRRCYTIATMYASDLLLVVAVALAGCAAQKPSAAPSVATSLPPRPVASLSSTGSTQAPDAGVDKAPPARDKAPLVDGVIFQDPALIMAMTQDAKHLFLGTTQGVVAISKADGTRIACTDSDALAQTQLVVTNSKVYWPANGGIEKVSDDCTTPDAEAFDDDAAEIGDLMADGHELYWNTSSVARAGDVPTSRLFRGSTDIGKSTIVWSGNGLAHVLGFDADRIYFDVQVIRRARPTLEVSRTFFVIKKSDGSVSPWSIRTGKKDTAARDAADQFAFDGGRVFMAAHSRAETKSSLDIDLSGRPHATLERSGSVLYVSDPKGPGFAALTHEMCPLVPLPTSIMRDPERLRVVGAWIYWTCRGGGPEAIHRMSARGGDVQTLTLIDTATEKSMGGTPLRDNLIDYVVDDNTLYWATHATTASVRRKTLTP